MFGGLQIIEGTIIFQFRPIFFLPYTHTIIRLSPYELNAFDIIGVVNLYMHALGILSDKFTMV